MRPGTQRVLHIIPFEDLLAAFIDCFMSRIEQFLVPFRNGDLFRMGAQILPDRLHDLELFAYLAVSKSGEDMAQDGSITLGQSGNSRGPRSVDRSN